MDQIVVMKPILQHIQKNYLKLGVPVLGLCYGAQLMMHVLGGKVERADVREYGKDRSINRQDSVKDFCRCFTKKQFAG